MDNARRKMKEGTPDGSPGSSRGCSPFSVLYKGPDLMEAIQSLHLSPANSPIPGLNSDSENSWNFRKNQTDGKIGFVYILFPQIMFFFKREFN